MTSGDELRSLVGSTAFDRAGEKIGTVGQVYVDDDTGQPTWVTVQTGLFGTGESFVPVEGAALGGDRVTVAYDKATVKDAPHIREDSHLSPRRRSSSTATTASSTDDRTRSPVRPGTGTRTGTVTATACTTTR
jgi:sporulation protein YlmC with PRC-barrel domain